MRFVSQCIAILNTHDSSTAPLFETISLIYLYHKNILKSYDTSTAALLAPISLYDKIILNTYDSSTAPLFEPISLPYLYHKVWHTMLLRSLYLRTNFPLPQLCGKAQYPVLLNDVTFTYGPCFVCMTTLNAEYHPRASPPGINTLAFHSLSPSCDSHPSPILPIKRLGPYLNHVSTSFKPKLKLWSQLRSQLRSRR